MSNLFILDTTRRQDEMFLSKLDEPSKKIAKKMIINYTMEHLFSSITIKYKDNVAQLRMEINKALEDREVFIQGLISRFKPIESVDQRF